MSAILFSSAIGPVQIECILSEGHQSTLGIAENPIETGAKVTDHSYVEPKRLELEFADSGAAATYNALVRFQESRVPFTITSGLYVYTSMLIKDLNARRDEIHSRILKGSALLQEVIIVSTARTAAAGDPSGGRRAQGNGTPRDAETADRTEGTVTRGDQPTTTTPPAENRSLLKRLFGH
jgi:hypothetical protein